MFEKNDIKEGPVQSHDPDQRVWEYDGDGNKIYKLNQGYQQKTPFWKGRAG